ncbi:MAG: hypothetical protein WBG46_13985 [Nonlabens sp.]
MPKKPDNISVFEYERLTTDKARRKSKQRISSTTYAAFLSYHDAHPDTPFFKLINEGVQFQQYVGAIRIGNTTIEVLPKAGKANEDDVGTWKKVLIDMLKTCHLLQAKQSGQANLRLKSNSILELYFELFIIEVEGLLRQGLIKKYQRTSGQQLALTGAIEFQQHLVKNLVHKERFFTRHTIYTKDHLLHSILFEALIVIKSSLNYSFLSDRLERTLSIFPKVARVSVNETMFDKIPLSRKHQPYQTAISIAKLILLNYRPDIKSGRKDLLAIMFDMNMLWEEYVLNIMKKNEADIYKVVGQSSKYFWETKKVKPDIYLQAKDSEFRSIILDTKWKLPEKSKPGDNDLKQMYVYNHYWQCSRSFLVYPSSESSVNVNGYYRKAWYNKSHGCCMVFLNVLKQGSLNKDLAKDILRFLLEPEEVIQ